jgi:two-component system, OmpR family, phosphate regulon response regulator PhoB
MRKLLVVDDDEALRRLMRLELGDTFEIVDTGVPEEGLALALEHKPSAILLDLRMPKYSGYELCQTFTSFSWTQMIPVIIVSGEAGAQTKEHCKQLGASDYFEKPVDFDALRKRLVQIVQDHHLNIRSEVRVRLHVPLQLRGTDVRGNKFGETATTENVSLSGFLCHCGADLSVDSIVDVFLTTPGEIYVGQARVVHSDTKTGAIRRYGCCFVSKTGPWILR